MSATAPSSREFTFLGITYGLFACGLFFVWTALIGLVLAYVKRDDVADSFLASHYNWLIRTFWWWALWWVAATTIVLAGVVPYAITIAKAVQTGNYLTIPWSMIGAGLAAAFVFSFAWLWVVYRLTRGALRLSDARAVP